MHSNYILCKCFPFHLILIHFWMSLSFIWCISYNWPDAVWAQSFQTAQAVSQAALSDSFSPHPPAVLDYYSTYMYSFCFLITLKYFSGENWTSILLFDWNFLMEDLRIILNRKKKKSIHPSSCEEWTARGQNQTGLLYWVEWLRATPLSCVLLSSPLDFHTFSPVKARASPSCVQWEPPWFSRGCWIGAGLCVWCWRGSCSSAAGQGQARRGRAGSSCSVLGAKFHLLKELQQLHPTSAGFHPRALLEVFRGFDGNLLLIHSEGSFIPWC